MRCRHCGHDKVVKDGIVHGKQRYKCKACARTTREDDKRYKYSPDKRLKVLKMYLEGVGIMSIERLEGVPNPLIIYWIRHAASIIKDKLASMPLSNDLKDIEILEMDELYSYVKKNATESTFGLLLIGNKIKLLTLK